MNTLEIHTFEAATMPEALAKVRKELGSDAVILQTRQHSKRGLTGLRPGSVEIIATPATEASAKLLRPTAGPKPQVSEGELVDVQEMIAHLSQLVDDLYTQKPEEPDPIFEPWKERFVAAEVPVEVIAQCQKELKNEGCRHEWSVREVIREFFAGRLNCGSPATVEKEEKLVALVGPPGGGKTTTIAKLAANARFSQGKRVLVVATDMHRIGAVEQAQTFSEIMDVEFAAPRSPKELRDLLGWKDDFDLTLVDTDSQSRSDSQTQAMQQELIDAGCTTWLVVDANLRASSLHGAMSRYAPLQYNRVILTKLDEMTHPLSLLGSALRLDKPLKYVSTGPQVPDDLRAAEPGWLVDFGLCLLEKEIPAAA